jgi:tetratricopeptide (TPR) repeat protein
MGQKLVDKMLPTLNKMEWPESPVASALGLKTYEIGRDKADEYSGNPKSLIDALRIFQSGDSRPFAFAGVAYTLVKAALESDNSYAQKGLDAALDWLEKAQALAADVTDINVIEVDIYIYGGRLDDARLVLDYLKEGDPANYYSTVAEANYWQHKGEIDDAIYWYQRAIDDAGTVPRKLYLRARMGDCYLQFGQYQQALEVYKEAEYFSKDNPYLMHKMSIAHWHLKEYRESSYYNKEVLAQINLPEAQQLENALKQELGTGGLTDRLFRRDTGKLS